MDAPSEALAEGAGHDGQLAGAADDVDAGDLREVRRVAAASSSARHDGDHGLDGALDEGAARLVEVGDGEGQLGARGGRAERGARGRW